MKHWLLCITLLGALTAATASTVELRQETINLPTYEMGEDDVNPLFRDYRLPGFRISRGSRSCYPYTIQDKFQEEKVDKTYEALILENEHIKVIVLPELRGRIQGAIDKRNGWDFLYYNKVIKPADIAVRQGWIAGGLEPNHPGGHGYTQFTSISHVTRDEPDGGKTIIIAEIEPVRMMKWEYEITLRPGKLYLETTGRLIGIEPFPVQFASSQNAAMHATEEMEVIYPDGTYITGHGKRTATPWPISDGIDYSKWKGTNRRFSVFTDGLGNFTDYYGCYSHDEGIEAGSVVVADHRTVPGKKYFSWGNDPEGRMWDTLLSDEDGPYIELQSQAFWDNLGYGYAWLNPMEVKEFTIYWYPVMQTKGFKAANQKAAVNLELDKGDAFIAVQSTEAVPNARIILSRGKMPVFQTEADLTLDMPWLKTVQAPEGVSLPDLRLSVYDSKGKEIISYQKLSEMPEPPVPPKKKSNMAEMTLDELYQQALTYYHDPFQPEAEGYLQEMLKRDEMESRAHRFLGIMAYQQGKFEKAKDHLETALINDPLNRGYESNLYLGLVEKSLGDLDQAKKCLTVASRNQVTAVQALYHLAEIAILEKNPEGAVHFLQDSLRMNSQHPMLFNLLAVANREAGWLGKGKEVLDASGAADPLNFIACAEKWLQSEDSSQAAELNRLFDREEDDFTGTQLYVETAVFYLNLGMNEDAIKILELAVDHFRNRPLYAMVDYYLGYAYALQKDEEKARTHYTRAVKDSDPYVNPYRAESIPVLEMANKLIGDEALTHKRLASLYAYLRQHEKAREHWRMSAELDPGDAVVLRNLANVTWYLDEQIEPVVKLLEDAQRTAPGDVRIFTELNYVYDGMGAFEKRMQLFEKHPELVEENDEVKLSLVTLLLRQKKYAEVIDLMKDGYFSATEFIAERHARYAMAHLGHAENLINMGNPKQAVEYIRQSMEFPDHLSEGAPAYLVTIRQNYLLGKAYQKMEREKESKRYFNQAITGLCNDPSESMYYKALAYRELGMDEQAHFTLFQMATNVRSSGDLSYRGRDSSNPIRNYLTALANIAQEHADEAELYLEKAKESDPDYLLTSFIYDRSLKTSGY